MSAPLATDLEISREVLRRWHEDVPNDRLAHLVRDTWRAFQRSLSLRLARHGVPHGHWTFLRVLWERDGLTQRELAIRAGVSEPATLAALRAMERAGHLTRRHRPGNRKNVYVVLTRSGKALRRKLVPLAVEVNAVATRGTRAADVSTTRRVLLAILVRLAHDELALSAQAGGVRPGRRPARPRAAAPAVPAAPRQRRRRGA
jgi:DNA-binding MarR family transcriptional regulator